MEKEKAKGATIDNKLIFEQHMNEKTNKVNRSMGLIRWTFTLLDEEILLLLYKALVRPHLEYVNTIWMEPLQNKRPNSNSECIEASKETYTITEKHGEWRTIDETKTTNP